jgi:hypothetical protein
MALCTHCGGGKHSGNGRQRLCASEACSAHSRNAEHEHTCPFFWTHPRERYGLKDTLEKSILGGTKAFGWQQKWE